MTTHSNILAWKIQWTEIPGRLQSMGQQRDKTEHIGDSLEKTLMLGKIEGRRRKRQQRMKWLNGMRLNEHESEQTQGDSAGEGSLAHFQSMDSQRAGHNPATELQQQHIH